jgi:hypothetical protein
MQQDNLLLAYFDSLGFECVINLTEIDKKAMWAALTDKPTMHKFPVGALIMRAKANPQRFPEIWTFWSSVDIETVIEYSKDSPQELADLIREKGKPVFVTHKSKEVIK